MIQRIQSIYLVLAGIFSAFTCFVPVATFNHTDGKGAIWFHMSSIEYYGSVLFESLSEMTGRHPWGLAVMAALTTILAVVAIFCFKNRKRQVKMVNVCSLINVVWYVAFAAYAFSVKSRTAFDLSLEVGCLFPLLSLITLFLAKRAIKHDEALVRAADRIR